MASWEEEYQKQAALEEERYRRQLAAAARRRAHRKKLVTLIGAAALFVAVTAVIVAATLGNSEEPRDRDDGDTGKGFDFDFFLGRDDESKDGDDEVQDTGDKDRDPVDPEDIVIPDWITVDLLPVNEYSRPGEALPQVNGVVVHYVGNPNTTAKQNRSYFANLATTHETSASSHFLVGLDGEILLIVPLDEISYCSTIRNHDTIAIECCHPDETGKFNEATTESLIKLLKWLCETYDLDREDVIRHYDVAGKVCPKYYVDHPDAWEDLKDQVFD